MKKWKQLLYRIGSDWWENKFRLAEKASQRRCHLYGALNDEKERGMQRPGWYVLGPGISKHTGLTKGQVWCD